MFRDFHRRWIQHRQATLYFLLAGAGAAVDLGLFLILKNELGTFAASSAATTAAAVANFLLNANFTFGSSVTSRLAARFFLVAVLAALLGGVVTALLSLSGLVDALSKVFSMALLSVIQLAIHTRWTFR